MSTKCAARRSTPTQENDCLAVTNKGDRSAVKPKVGRLTATNKNDRPGPCATLTPFRISTYRSPASVDSKPLT